MSNLNINNDNLSLKDLTILSGDRPTGHLHLGHYVGSLKRRLELQDNNKTYIMIANVQALTDYYDNPRKIHENILNVMEDYISVGLDPAKSIIFLQSEIKSLFEMTVYFMNLVTVSRAQRNPTVKGELEQKSFKNHISCGFLCYPISQAADILAFKTDIVPVGKDQEPMIEQTNEIVDQFNKIYNSNVLKRCKTLLGTTPKLLGIDGQCKASKSLNNAIFLNDSDEAIKNKVFAMYTDPNHIRVQDPGKIEGNVVFHYLDAFYDKKEHLEELKTEYQKGGLGDVTLKNILYNILLEFLEPIRQRRLKINEKDLIEILAEGSKKANLIANNTLGNMQEVMFLN